MRACDQPAGAMIPLRVLFVRPVELGHQREVGFNAQYIMMNVVHMQDGYCVPAAEEVGCGTTGTPPCPRDIVAEEGTLAILTAPNGGDPWKIKASIGIEDDGCLYRCLMPTRVPDAMSVSERIRHTCFARSSGNVLFDTTRDDAPVSAVADALSLTSATLKCYGLPRVDSEDISPVLVDVLTNLSNVLGVCAAIITGSCVSSKQHLNGCRRATSVPTYASPVATLATQHARSSQSVAAAVVWRIPPSLSTAPPVKRCG